MLREPTPVRVRAIAERADELRFTEPDAALEVSAAAVEALRRFRAQPALKALVWAIHGSALRGLARLDDAESALLIAARLAGDPQSLAEVARRLATLRAEQRRPGEARALLPAFLDRARVLGGRYYGEELVAAGAVLIVTEDYVRAKALTGEALRFLPRNADRSPRSLRIHLSAVGNLCRCCLETAATPDEFARAAALARQTEELIGDDYTRCKMLWLRARLHQRYGEPDLALELLEAARPTIEGTHKALDRAILLVDLAEVHLDRGDATQACEVALQGFPLLGQLKTKPEAFRAIRAIQRAAETRGLDSQVLKDARMALELV